MIEKIFEKKTRYWIELNYGQTVGYQKEIKQRYWHEQYSAYCIVNGNRNKSPHTPWVLAPNSLDCRSWRLDRLLINQAMYELMVKQGSY